MDFTSLGEFSLSKKWILWLLFAYFILPFTIYLFVPFFTYRKSVLRRKSVSIFVLGDLGHSPRMCYHALSFAKIGYSVNFCGYIETEPPQAVTDAVNIDIFPIEAIQNRRKLPYLAFAVSKVAQQLLQLFRLLNKLQGSEYFMLQNPPSMPLLVVLVIYIKLYSPRSRLIVDWHNLNYSILGLKFGNFNHPLVRLMKFYERVFSRYAWLNITVTKQMARFLEEEFQVSKTKTLVLHDRPGPQFSPVVPEVKKQMLTNHSLFADVPNIENYKVLVTATSFTPDEDFDILLDALKLYHDSPSSSSPPLFVIVTGKGPMKTRFLHRVSELAFSERVIIKSAWLSAEDYPVILGVADLAVSLHTSSSGIDLPMKIVDFFGVGVPVITLSFPAIGELVVDGVNGLVTGGTSSQETINIHKEMYTLISRALSNNDLLETLKKGAMAESEKRWDQNWMAIMAPAVDKQ